jgi:hypothetical protein
MGRTHYFTSITNNYLPKARILARSIHQYDAEAVFHLVLCDIPPPGFALENEPFDHLHLVRDLEIPNVLSWLFQHELVEMCTGAKGPALWKILTEYDADQAYYFDPDIVVLDDLSGLKAQLAEASVVLTPHQVVPEANDEDIRINEITSLKYGVYNLGFLGVRRTEAGLAFARWWRDRLLSYCWADIPNGLFTDQRWCDLALALFDDVRVLRDKQYNVATWNLTHRRVTLSPEGKLVVDGKPIVFFHFSGFDSGGQMMMLKKYAPADSPLFEFHDWYIREMEAAGQGELGSLKGVYESYFNGEPIETVHRHVYRERPDLMARFPDPFAVDSDYSLRDWMKQELQLQPPERKQTPKTALVGSHADLTSTIAWRVGKAITGPIERAANLWPGLAPAIKRGFRRFRG